MPIDRASAPPLGSRLLGSPDETPRRRRLRVQTLLTASLLLTNLTGFLVVGVLISVVPGPWLLKQEYLFVNAVLGPIYVIAATVIGLVWGTLRALHGLRWAVNGEVPTREEATAALTMPWKLTKIQIWLWFVGMILVTTAYARINPETIPKVGLTIAMSGATICAFGYLLAEFALRPTAARALEAGDPRRVRIAGVAGRSLLAWILGTGVPVTGLIVVALFSLLHEEATPRQLAVSILAIGSATLVFGLLLTLLGVTAAVAPIRAVSAGMAQVEAGHLDTRIVVYDGTELGELQSGFNRMAAGLAERERVQELFGRHVGHDVAAAAIARNPELGGEEREIAVFFIDLVGSTQLAASQPPQQVVNLLNRFFEVVVDEVDRHGGFVNKFEGDAALAIFGAPADLPDPAGSALAAIRQIQRRLRAEVPDCTAAAGVAAGTAVAGNIGARKRFEYTVIGDPVNEAARLSELAKTVDCGILASDRAVNAADDAESALWTLGESVTLRGRSAPTRLATPLS
ncbi:adenylate/guanylate cyclase domain-containing protein [Rhodococcus kronopolitis]|uniref:Adenylate/guanylate cyclase domain-containing protein n=1 Tax=Rhodococcus kronopolitis TaxID=1460226 RepID=A0ABV9FNB2_9NOCA